jgi:mono/diheme cytochrome c family protein
MAMAVTSSRARRWSAVRREKLQHMLIGAAVAIAVVAPLGAFAFVKSGLYDVGASSPHTKFTEWVTHETMIHSVRRQAKGIEAPASFSAAQVRRGFCAYETHCVACHGASAVARQHWVSGLEPSPPYLLDATQRFTPSELFWIAKNGIKMTGMPSWRDSMSDEQLWDVVALLEAMPKMDSQTYVRWRAGGACGAPPLAPPLKGRVAQPAPGSSSSPPFQGRG